MRNSLQLVLHVMRPYEVAPGECGITAVDPSGSIANDQLSLCEMIYAEASERHQMLDQKAGSLLNTLALLIPLAISVGVFVVLQDETSGAAFAVALALVGSSAACLCLAFVATVRATAIRGYSSLFLDAVIDDAKGEIRPPDPNQHARGLLWCASANQAMNDHLADFVRGGQVLIAVGIFALGLSAVPTLLLAAKSPPSSKFLGRVALSESDLERIEAAHRDALVPVLDAMWGIVSQRQPNAIERSADELAEIARASQESLEAISGKLDSLISRLDERSRRSQRAER